MFGEVPSAIGDRRGISLAAADEQCAELVGERPAQTKSRSTAATAIFSNSILHALRHTRRPRSWLALDEELTRCRTCGTAAPNW